MSTSKRWRKFNYSVNNKRKKSNLKVFKTIKHYDKLKKRVDKEWDTKWLKNAFFVVEKKIKKYWIKI